MLDRVLTQVEFGILVGITQQAVSDLCRRGILKPNVTGAAWLIAYCEHLREEAAGRAGALAEASAGLKKAQREEVELRVAIKRKQVAPIGVISEVLAKVGRQAAVIFDGLVPALRMRWPDIPADQLRLIETEVIRARNLVAGISLSALVEDEEDDS